MRRAGLKGYTSVVHDFVMLTKGSHPMKRVGNYFCVILVICGSNYLFRKFIITMITTDSAHADSFLVNTFNAGADVRRQILTSKVDPRAEKIKNL